jgi:hypothetical protein
MRDSARLALLSSITLLASLIYGCGGCQQPPAEAPPKPVSGNAPKPRAAQPPAPVGEAKDICAVLVFSNDAEGAAPLTVQFTAEGDCTQGTAKVAWDFGDGSPPATGETVVHTFDKPGNYTVKGTITSDALPGVVDADTTDIVVSAAPQG